MRNRTKAEYQRAYEQAKECALKHVGRMQEKRPSAIDADRMFIESLYIVMGWLEASSPWTGERGSKAIQFDMIEDLRHAVCEQIFNPMVGE